MTVGSSYEGALAIVARPDGRDAGLQLLQVECGGVLALGLPAVRIAGS